MRSEQPTPNDIDEYIAGFPPDVQKILQKIRVREKRVIYEVGPVVKAQFEWAPIVGAGELADEFLFDKMNKPRLHC